jgi:hypothetical protein
VAELQGQAADMTAKAREELAELLEAAVVGRVGEVSTEVAAGEERAEARAAEGVGLGNTIRMGDLRFSCSSAGRFVG